MKKRTITLYLLSIMLLSVYSCINDDQDDKCSTEHALRFYALNREGVNELPSVIRNLQLSAYQQNTFIRDKSLPRQDSYTPILPAGTFTIVTIANLSDTLAYDSPVTEIRLKPSTNGYYHPAGDIFFGKTLFMSRPLEHSSTIHYDSVYLNRAVGKVRVIINKIPLADKDYRGEVVVSGTAIGINKFDELLNQPVKVMNSGHIVNKRLVVDVVCFPSLAPLVVETALRNQIASNQDYLLSRTLNERVTPNKLIILEYEYQASGTIVELNITVVDWDKESDNSSEEAS